MMFDRFLGWITLVSLAIVGCALVDEAPKKGAPTGLIVTPASYYSTSKARYLGAKYNERLDRLVERIVRNPKTASLQFANNIASVGGIGFFTHAATNRPDERYLEVILGVPETFEAKGDYSAKVFRLFSLYGTELLAILAGDSDIYQEREVSGYGLNFSWRNVTPDGSGQRVTVERAVAYFPKEKARNFLRQQTNQNNLLGEAVIFAVEEGGPMAMVSFRAQQLKPDFRPPIREETIAGLGAEPESSSVASASLKPPMTETPKSETEAESLRQVEQTSPDRSTLEIAQGGALEKIAEVAALGPVQEKPSAGAMKPSAPVVAPAPQERPGQKNVAKQVAINEGTHTTPQGQKALEEMPEGESVAPAVTPKSRGVTSPFVQSRESLQPRKTSERLAPASAGKGNQAAGQTTIATESKAGRAPFQSVGDTIVAERAPMVSPAQESEGPVKTGEARAKPQDMPRAKVSEARPRPTAEEKNIEVASGAPGVGSSPAPVTLAPPRAIESSPQEKVSESKSLESVVGQAPPVQSRAMEERKPDPAPTTRKVEIQAQRAKTPPVMLQGQQEKVPDRTANDQIALVRPKQVETVPETKAAAEIAAPKVEVRTPQVVGPPEIVPQSQGEKGSGVLPNEQLALLRNKPSEARLEQKPLPRPAPRALEGYIIQLAFADRGSAQRWAETLERRGYAVSVTEAAGAESVRVRVGNFTVRDEAEKQLRTLRQEGLAGFVINLPQAYRPEARFSIP